MDRIESTWGIKTVLIALLSMTIFCGCDPEFRYEFSGNIEGELNKRVDVHYNYRPLDGAHSWMAMI